ncbi:MAG: hypothetical protein ACMUHX_08090 [bacterium]
MPASRAARCKRQAEHRHSGGVQPGQPSEPVQSFDDNCLCIAECEVYPSGNIQHCRTAGCASRRWVLSVQCVFFRLKWQRLCLWHLSLLIKGGYLQSNQREIVLMKLAN